MKKWAKFLSLSVKEKGLLIKAFFVLAVVKGVCVFFPFRVLRRWITASSADPSDQVPQDSSSLEKIIWAVSVASSHLPGAETCLVQALATQMMLQHEGFPSRLQMGLTKSEEGG